MTRSARIGALLAAATACVPLAGCGDDDVGENISGTRAQAFERQLDDIQDDIDAGLCDEGITKVAQLRTEIDELDDEGVGSDVQDALGDGVDRLGELAREICEQNEEPIETTPETTPEPTITETTPEPTITETTPEPTTPEPTTPVPAPEPEPDEGDGGTQFDPDAELPPGQGKKQDDD
ncbi:MAG: hypothetical protein ACRDJY_07265 [Thermoleophilaceae bacterium]